MSTGNLRCVLCRDYLLEDPMQCDCGDRLCKLCYQSLRDRNQKTFICPSCQSTNQLADCFRDRAVVHDICNSTLKCLNPSCPWEGENKFYLEHTAVCKFGAVPCPNSQYGCKDPLIRSDIDGHIKNDCDFNPVTCKWCNESVVDEKSHVQNDCDKVPQYCPNGCGDKLPKREHLRHTQTVCTHQVRNCEYSDLGCQVKANIKELTKHAKEHVAYHNQLLKIANNKMKQTLEAQTIAFERQEQTLNNQLAQIKSEMSAQLQPALVAVSKSESAINSLRDGLSEVSLLLQTLQAASYDGTFIWKIPEVNRRRQEAKAGKTVSLYSAPFYTSRHGCKVCLRLYMNGDGAGKGSHLSFFITLMRGEYDALLSWPFRQSVTLILLAQNKQKDIVQSFRPEATSSSFQRPRAEMNVASGCPMFAPLSLLDNSSYVKDDTVFFKCKINTVGLLND